MAIGPIYKIQMIRKPIYVCPAMIYGVELLKQKGILEEHIYYDKFLICFRQMGHFNVPFIIHKIHR